MADLAKTQGRRGAKLDLFRRDMENLRSELEDAEELVLKQKREINDLKNSKETLESETSRMQKAKKRMQNELDQLNAIFDQEKNDIAELEGKLKRINKNLAEERKRREVAEDAKHDMLKNVKNMENKIDDLEVENSQKDKQINDGDMQRKQLLVEKEVLADSRDAAKSHASNMEKDKKYVEALLHEARNANADLESQISDIEKNLVSLQGTLQASKDQFTKDLQRKEEKIDEYKRAADKAERDLKLTTEEEKKKREQLVNSKKSLETKISGLNVDLEEANRRNEEQQRVIRKYQNQLSQFRELQVELGEMAELKDSLLRELKDMEKRVKHAETENENLQGQLQASERAKRAAEEEASDAREEAQVQKNLLIQQKADEKRMLEEKMNELKLDLQDEKSKAFGLEEQYKRVQKESENANDKLAQEKDERKGLEFTKSRLEKEKKELDDQVSKLDQTLKNKIRETTEMLERRMHQMEVDLDGEIKEREALSKQLRRTDKELSDTSLMLVESQEAEESYRGQVEKLSKKVDQLKNELVTLEDDLKRANLTKAVAEGDLEEKQDECEALKRECQRLRGGASRGRSRMEPADELSD